MSAPEPNRPSTFEGARPPSSRRPRTDVRRVPTARPDTGASGIGPLPDQTFFSEGEESEEDEEESEDEEEPDQNGVFAFARPVTAAPIGGLAGYTTSDYGSSAPNTGLHPTTAGTYASEATFGVGSTQSPQIRQASTSTGVMDVGGHLPELEYDPSHAPPMSGRSNLNNSSFAFMNKLHNEGAGSKGKQQRPLTGRSLLDRLHRRNLGTASTAVTGTTDYTQTTDMINGVTDDSKSESDRGSFVTETTDAQPRSESRRMRSSAPLIAGSNASDFTSETGARRGMSRGSYGMTEMTGAMTVPDGKVTWGDGMGGLIKQDSEAGSMVAINHELAEEDSPYAEVRASVSNLDDPDMPGE